MDILSELVLAAIAICIVWSLKMRLSKRIVVAFAFVQRLAIIAPIVARLYFLSITYHTKDPTLHATYSTLCKEVEVAFAIVAASLPCLKPFLTAIATHYGAPAEGLKSTRGEYAYTASPLKLRSTQGPGSFNLKRLNLSNKKELSTRSGWPEDDMVHHVHNGSAVRNHCTVTVCSNRSGDAASIESDDRKGLIIWKDVNYEVQYCERETDKQHVQDD